MARAGIFYKSCYIVSYIGPVIHLVYDILFQHVHRALDFDLYHLKKN